MSGRIRTIKPEWLDNQRMAHASSDARVLSIALLCMADDYGRGRFDLVTTAMRVFPPLCDSPESLMRTLERFRSAAGELSEMGYFGTYRADGQDYYAIIKWHDHQKVQHPSKNNRMPDPPETLMKVARKSHEEIGGDLIPSLPDPDPEGVQGEPLRQKPPDPLAYMSGRAPHQRSDVGELFDLFCRTFGFTGRKLDAPNARLDAETLAEAIDSYGLDDCKLVCVRSRLDRMVTGEADDHGIRHDSIKYIFGNADTFARVLRAARDAGPEVKRGSVREVIAAAKALGSE